MYWFTVKSPLSCLLVPKRALNVLIHKKKKGRSILFRGFLFHKIAYTEDQIRFSLFGFTFNTSQYKFASQEVSSYQLFKRFTEIQKQNEFFAVISYFCLIGTCMVSGEVHWLIKIISKLPAFHFLMNLHASVHVHFTMNVVLCQLLDIQSSPFM